MAGNLTVALGAAAELRPAQPAQLKPEAESKLLARLRRRLLVSMLRQMLRTAQLRLGLAVGLSIVFWLSLFAITYEGFTFLHSVAGVLTSDIEPKIFNLFYASLLLMLIFSSGIILYGGLYSNREVTFLLSTPIRPAAIFSYKFQEAALLSSWGFILLGSPLLVSYGIVVGAPWYYFVLLFPYLIAFALIPAGLGAIGCLLIVRYLTRVRKKVFIGLSVCLVLGTILLGWAVIAGSDGDLLTMRWFEQLKARLGSAENRLLPSWWLSSGLLEAARNDGQSLEVQPWAQALLFLALLASNALAIHLVGVALAGRLLRESYSRLNTIGSAPKRSGIAIADRLAGLIVRPLPVKTRLLLLKDFRIFRRDPTQWSQFLIFFGLVLFYFINVHRISYDRHYAVWINIVSFLNLGVVALILSTFTTRFIFPMISLEGRRFWVLGLLPVKRDTILWGKFVFSSLGSVLTCNLMILLSDVMLRISPAIMLVHQIACVALCVGLSAIAVGLGAKMPDLRETNPSKIAAGFGGTLNLVVSALYIVVVVVITALPCYYYVQHRSAVEGLMPKPSHIGSIPVGWAVAAGCAAAIALGLLATIVPMRIGLRAFRRLEF